MGFGGAAGAVDFAAGVAATGFGAVTGAFALAGGGGPNVIRGRNGSADTRGSEMGRSCGATGGDVSTPCWSPTAAPGDSKARKPATAGSEAFLAAGLDGSAAGGAGGGACGGATFCTGSPNPVVHKADAVD